MFHEKKLIDWVIEDIVELFGINREKRSNLYLRSNRVTCSIGVPSPRGGRRVSRARSGCSDLDLDGKS